MRRWIFAALVLANLGLFLWGVQYVEPERPTRADAPDDVNPANMKLLNELPLNKLNVRPKSPPPPPPTPALAPTADGQVCYRLGPIADAAQVKKMEQALGAQSLAFTKREEPTRRVTGYRVFLPSFASREEAERQRRELTRLGFRDHALMQDDGFQNAVSLGLFAVEDNARIHLKRLAEKGVKAELKEIEQIGAVSWLEVTPAEGMTDTPTRLRAVIEGVAGVGIVNMPCAAPVIPTSPTAEPPVAG